MSYTIDVYKNETPVEKHFGYFSLFVSFWPMLLAGPIERSNHLIPQFRKKFVWDYERIMMATNRISFGFFKKMVVADRLSMYVNEVYANLDSYGTLPIIIAAIFFSIQIYCDFSGYCDIAIGVAMIIDFDLFENFNRPYTATSIKDFWSRWHMSLSRWFRDYVYIPLGGNRVSEGKKIRNLMVTFLVSGLWHGANFTYIFWGALHGIYQVIGTYTESFRTKVRTTLGIEGTWLSRAQQTVITFILVTFAWIFFRAKNFDHAFHIIGKIAA
ncbi:MAG: MBOAT family O-acyltransferase, partial [Flexibacteraceae bacterium]